MNSISRVFRENAWPGMDSHWNSHMHASPLKKKANVYPFMHSVYSGVSYFVCNILQIEMNFSLAEQKKCLIQFKVVRNMYVCVWCVVSSAKYRKVKLYFSQNINNNGNKWFRILIGASDSASMPINFSIHSENSWIKSYTTVTPPIP